MLKGKQWQPFYAVNIQDVGVDSPTDSDSDTQYKETIFNKTCLLCHKLVMEQKRTETVFQVKATLWASRHIPEEKAAVHDIGDQLTNSKFFCFAFFSLAVRLFLDVFVVYTEEWPAFFWLLVVVNQYIWKVICNYDVVIS